MSDDEQVTVNKDDLKLLIAIYKATAATIDSNFDGDLLEFLCEDIKDRFEDTSDVCISGDDEWDTRFYHLCKAVGVSDD